MYDLQRYNFFWILSILSFYQFSPFYHFIIFIDLRFFYRKVRKGFTQRFGTVILVLVVQLYSKAESRMLF